MSAKAKALQVMVVIGISAITYSVYQSASRNDIRPVSTPTQLKSVHVENEQNGSNTKTAPDERSMNNIPGYCDPDLMAR